MIPPGGVASRFTVIDADADPPSLVTVQVNVVPAVSVVCVVGSHPTAEVMGDSGSS